MGRIREVAVSVMVGAVLVVGGCAPGGNPGGVSPDPVASGPHGAVASVHEDVQYYPACGNEILDYEGTTWFPFASDESETWATPVALAEPASGGLGGGLARVDLRLPTVVAPGPGDDVGTLTVYEDGIGYWVSDNGELDTWLTTTPLEYNWVC